MSIGDITRNQAKMDIEQLVYQFPRKNHVEIYKLFDSKEAEKLSDLSIQSTECMKRYADYLIERSIEYAAMANKTDSVIDWVKDYPDSNYCNAVSMEVGYNNFSYFTKYESRQ